MKLRNFNLRILFTPTICFDLIWTNMQQIDEILVVFQFAILTNTIKLSFDCQFRSKHSNFVKILKNIPRTGSNQIFTKSSNSRSIVEINHRNWFEFVQQPKPKRIRWELTFKINKISKFDFEFRNRDIDPDLNDFFKNSSKIDWILLRSSTLMLWYQLIIPYSSTINNIIKIKQ